MISALLEPLSGIKMSKHKVNQEHFKKAQELKSFYLRVGSCLSAQKEKQQARKLLKHQVGLLYPKTRKATKEDHESINRQLLKIRVGIEKKGESILEYKIRKEKEYKKMVRQMLEDFPQYSQIGKSMLEQNAVHRSEMALKATQATQIMPRMIHELITPFKISYLDYHEGKLDAVGDAAYSMADMLEKIKFPYIRQILAFSKKQGGKFSLSHLKMWSECNPDLWDKLLNTLYKRVTTQMVIGSNERLYDGEKEQYLSKRKDFDSKMAFTFSHKDLDEKYEAFHKNMIPRIDRFIEAYENYQKYS